ncbi:MAG: type II toxin-antitoxin system RelE/ParE family toxin [Candidatus Roizmanbacteria bacterium]|nr:type II toxin-antitoxin system RelE/ParE family toxin [Candidatus Roizmanbacteria bacterium]
MRTLRLGGLKGGQRLEKMYEVLISHEAEKYYKGQDKNTKRRLNKCTDNLCKEPLFGPHIKRLHGELEGKYRYELGGFRIVYEVNGR